MVPPTDSARGEFFRTTRWSLFLAIRFGSCPTPQQEALGKLCAIYWRPIFNFIRSRGHDPFHAQDLTQAFFVYLIEREAFAKADKSRGMFRSYVIGTLKHFLWHAWRNERTLKRGGGAQPVPLDDAVTNETETEEARRKRLAQPSALDRKWARAVRERVSDRIAREYMAAGKSEMYLTLRRHLTGEKVDRAYDDDAARLGRPVVTIRSDVARMRRRNGEILLEELRREAPTADLRQELFHYCRIIAGECEASDE